MKAWHEQDAFWEKWAPFIFQGHRWEDTPDEVTNIISLLGIGPGASILDLCCGPGRHSLELARRGFSVTGVDRTGAYLEEARKQAEVEVLTVEFVQDDMRSFCRPGTFDAAINMFTSFGYFEGVEDDRQVITNMHRSLKNGGVLLIDIMGKEVLARIFRQRNWRQLNDITVLQEHRVCRDWSWIENRWIMIKDGKREEYTVSHRIYSAVELATLLSSCGFAAVHVYGDLSGAPYDNQAKRLVVVAHKGEDRT